MATAIGEKFARRHSAAETNVSNSSATDQAYDTSVFAEGGYSWLTPEVDVDETGLFLAIHSGITRDSGTQRSTGYNELFVDNVSQGLEGRTDAHYTRLSGGANEGNWLGAALLDLTSGQSLKTRRSLSSIEAGVGDYDRGLDDPVGLQLVRMPDGNVTHLTITTADIDPIARDDTLTRPNLDATDTWTEVDWQNEIVDPDGRWGSGAPADILLADGDKVMAVATFQTEDTDSGRHTIRVRALLDGVPIRHGSNYHRNATTNFEWQTFLFCVEASGAQTLTFEAIMEDTSNDNSGEVDEAVIKILTLPAGAEWFDINYDADWDTPLVSTSATYTAPHNNVKRAMTGWSIDTNGAQNDTGATVSGLVMANHNWDRDSGASGSRKQPSAMVRVNSVLQAHAIAGEFSRGNQGSDDCFNAAYTLACLVDVPDTQIVDVQCFDEATAANSDIGIYASNNSDWLSLQVLDLGSLAASGDETATPSVVTAVGSVGTAVPSVDVTHAATVVTAAGVVPAAVGGSVTTHSSTVVTGVGEVLAAVPDASSAPTVTDVETDEDFRDGDTAVTITGTEFEATQGTGKVEISDNATYATGTKVAQTVTSWADTSVDFTAVLGALDAGSLWLWVTNDFGHVNAAGMVVLVRRKIPVVLSDSSFITAGGEDTTAIMTAPTGKSGDFTTGRAWKAENGSDSINIADSFYTELAHAFEGVAGVAEEQVIILRYVYNDGTALDSYPVEMKITFAAAGTTATPSVVTAVGSVGTAVPTVDVTHAASVVTGVGVVPAATPDVSVFVSASVVTGIGVVPAPTTSSDAAHASTVVTGIGVVPAAVPSVDVTHTATVITGIGEVLAAVPGVGVTHIATVVTATGSVGTPTTTSSATHSSTVVTAIGLVVAPTTSSDATHAASVVTAIGEVLAAIGSTGTTVIAAVVTAIGEIPAAVPSVDVTLTSTVVTGIGEVLAAVGGSGITVSAVVVTGIGSVGTTTTAASSTIAAVVVTGIGSVGTPTTTSDATFAAAVITAIGSVLAAVGSTGIDVSGTVVTAAGEVGTPTTSSDSTITSAVVTAIGSVLAAVPTTGTVAIATVVTAIGSLGTAVTAASSTIAAAVVTAIGSVLAAVGSIDITHSSTVVTGIGEIPTAAAASSVDVSGAVVTGVGEVPSPTAGGDSGVAGAVVTATGEVGTPTTSTSVTASGAVVTGIGEVGDVIGTATTLFPGVVVTGIGLVGAAVGASVFVNEFGSSTIEWYIPSTVEIFVTSTIEASVTSGVEAVQPSTVAGFAPSRIDAHE